MGCRIPWLLFLLLLSLGGTAEANTDSVTIGGLLFSHEKVLGVDSTVQRAGILLHARFRSHTFGLEGAPLRWQLKGERLPGDTKGDKLPGLQAVALYGPGVRIGNLEIALQTGIGLGGLGFVTHVAFPAFNPYIDIPVRGAAYWNPRSMLAIGGSLTAGYAHGHLRESWHWLRRPRVGGQFVLAFGGPN
jgi:hypothetical protein